MNISHLSDLHVTNGPRLDDQADTLAQVITDALATEPDLWLLTGDLYGHTVPHRSTPAEREALHPQLVRMANQAPVVIVQGNHDHEIDVLTLRHLGGQWPVKVYARAKLDQVITRAGVVDLYVLPYPTKRWLLAGEQVPAGVEASQAMVQAKLGMLLDMWAGRMRRARKRSPSTPQVFAGHLQVRGSALGSGVVLAGQEIELTRAQLDGLPVDYGALGHLHALQETADRYWYAGSLWNISHGKHLAPRSWMRVTIDTDSSPDELGRLDYDVQAVASPCRPFTTLDFRWAQPDGEAAPCWVEAPGVLSAEPPWALKGAEVRARLVVPAQHVASCPWSDILERIAAQGAHRVVAERTIEPVLRVRAPVVAAASTLEEKIAAYWGTLGTELTAAERDEAKVVLAEIRQHDDDEIKATTGSLVGV